MNDQNLQLACSNATQQWLHDLVIENAAGVTIVNDLRVNNELDLIRQLAVPAFVTISGTQHLFLRGTSVLNNEGMHQRGWPHHQRDRPVPLIPE